MSAREAFEAKVSAKRETGAGIFITFEIQPDDYGQALAMLRVGAHLIVGWEEIVSTNVEPIEVPEKPAASGSQRERLKGVAVHTPETPPQAPKPDRRPFHTLPLAQQAGIRAGDDQFFRFLILCRAAAYSNAAAGAEEAGAGQSEVAAESIRLICGVNSRQQLSTDHDAANKWRALEAQYQRWLTDQKYSEAIRR